MALSCTFGLATCIAFNGASIPVDDAITILDTCQLIRELDPRSFADSDMGGVAGEKIEDLGLRLEWPQAGLRKLAWLRTCDSFERAFYAGPAK